jgi:hypothetical protein
MKYQFRFLLCLLSTLSAQVNSQESGVPDSNAVAEAESRFLFINMLEFLGEFETETGEWVNPEILGNDVFSDLDAGNLNTGSDRRVLPAVGDDGQDGQNGQNGQDGQNEE